MKIVNCGYNYRHADGFQIQRPNGSGDYIVLIVRSPAFFRFNDTVCHTTGNAVVLFRKGTPQIYGANGAEFVNDWIHFEAQEVEIEEWMSMGIRFDHILEFPSVSELSSIIRNMCYEIYSNNQNADTSAALYFRLMMLKISDYCHAAITESESALTKELTELRQNIFLHPGQKWSVENMAKQLSISISYLQHQYKAFFGTGIKQDITTSRIEYAKYLLFSTDYTVGTIAQLCGYENDVHFMRTFKAKTDCTPTEYRKQTHYTPEKVDDAKHRNPFVK